MKIFWQYIQGNRRRFLAALGIGLLYTAVCVVVPMVSGELINGFLDSPALGWRMLVLYLLLSGLQMIFFLLDQKASKDFEIGQTQLMRRNVFGAITRRDRLSKEKIAGYSSFVNNDIPAASSQFFLGAIDIAKCIALIGLSALSLMKVHFLLGLTVVLLSAAIVYVPELIRDLTAEARKAHSQALADYNAQFQSYLGGLNVIAAYGYRRRANQFMEQRNQGVAASNKELCKHQRFVQGVTSFLQTAKTVLILVIGILLIAREALTIGGLVVVLELDEVIGAPIEFLSYMIQGKNEAAPLVEENTAASSNLRRAATGLLWMPWRSWS